jgi:hypothetical protein
VVTELASGAIARCALMILYAQPLILPIHSATYSTSLAKSASRMLTARMLLTEPYATNQTTPASAYAQQTLTVWSAITPRKAVIVERALFASKGNVGPRFSQVLRATTKIRR